LKYIWTSVALLLCVGSAHGAGVPGPCVNVLSENKLWYQNSRMGETKALLLQARQEGFRSIRLNLFPAAVAEGGVDAIDAWYQSLRVLVTYGNSVGLHMIIDLHESNRCGVDSSECRRLTTEFWSRTAGMFSDTRFDVSYELLNEPKGEMVSQWGALYPQLIKLVRSKDRHHSIIVGGKGYSTIWDLPPADPDQERIIYTFHYYNPMSFTHQGADWLKAHPSLAERRNIGWGSYADRTRLAIDFRSVDGWRSRNDAPLFLGEFGVFKRAPAEDRVVWLSSVARMSEQRGITWCLFDYEGGFGVEGLLPAIQKGARR